MTTHNMFFVEKYFLFEKQSITGTMVVVFQTNSIDIFLISPESKKVLQINTHSLCYCI